MNILASPSSLATVSHLGVKGKRNCSGTFGGRRRCFINHRGRGLGVFNMGHMKKAPRQWPIFPLRCQSSIVSAGAFHFRVRDGDGWVHPALTTKGLYHTNSMGLFRPYSKGFRRGLLIYFQGNGPALGVRPNSAYDEAPWTRVCSWSSQATQWYPSSKNSFFQMGTVSLMRSTVRWQA